MVIPETRGENPDQERTVGLTEDQASRVRNAEPACLIPAASRSFARSLGGRYRSSESDLYQLWNSLFF